MVSLPKKSPTRQPVVAFTISPNCFAKPDLLNVDSSYLSVISPSSVAARAETVARMRNARTRRRVMGRKECRFRWLVQVERGPRAPENASHPDPGQRTDGGQEGDLPVQLQQIGRQRVTQPLAYFQL